MSKYIDADELMRRCRGKASLLNILSKGYSSLYVLSIGEIDRIVDEMPAWMPLPEPPKTEEVDVL